MTIDTMPINIEQRNKTDLVCIRCVPPHIKGVCTCEKPIFIPISDWLHLDNNGRRDFTVKYQHLLKESAK
jgi:hypothetical protein